MLSMMTYAQSGTVMLSDRDKDALSKDHRNDIPVVTYNDSIINIIGITT